MNKNLLALLLMSAFIAPAIADKSEGAGKGKPELEQKATHESVMKSKGFHDDNDGRIMDQKEHSDEIKGLEKQQEMKTEQTQRELGKGSEKGQESRAENRKKWWKFWGE